MLKTLFLKFLRLLYFGDIMNFDVASKIVNIINKIPNDDIIEFYEHKYLDFKHFRSLLRIAISDRDKKKLREAYNYFGEELYKYTNEKLKERNIVLNPEYHI